MINDGIDAIDIASALLKFYMSKEGKKINKNIVFETSPEEISEKRNRNRDRNRNGRDRRNRRDNKNKSDDKFAKITDFQKDKRNKRKTQLHVSVDDMIMSVKEISKKEKKNSPSKSFNKTSSDKFKKNSYGNFNKKSKSKSNK